MATYHLSFEVCLLRSTRCVRHLLLLTHSDDGRRMAQRAQLIAIAPVIGTARIVSAASHITRAFYLAGELAGAVEEAQAEDGK